MRAALPAVLAFLLVSLPCSAADDAVLWQAPGTITVSDWTWGVGGQAKAPQPPFRFIAEDFHGTNPKVRVRDAKGDQWTVKFGGEVHSDVFASRLLYATGYLTVPSYYVAAGTIAGAHDLKRAKPFIARDGSFRSARFKLRDNKTLVPVATMNWSWTGNPFLGTPQLGGLKILMMLMSNWDAKDARDGKGSNTSVYARPGRGPGIHFYSFDDWGAGMGKWGGFFQRDKWDPDGFEEQSASFVRAAPNGAFAWGYRGKHGADVTSSITPRDVRWLLQYLAPVTDEELRAGLQASGATAAETDAYTRSLRERIAQLQKLSATTAPAVITARGGTR